MVVLHCQGNPCEGIGWRLRTKACARGKVPLCVGFFFSARLRKEEKTRQGDRVRENRAWSQVGASRIKDCA